MSSCEKPLSFIDKLLRASIAFGDKEEIECNKYEEQILRFADTASMVNDNGRICLVIPSEKTNTYTKIPATDRQMVVYMPWFEKHIIQKSAKHLDFRKITESCTCPDNYDCRCPPILVYYEVNFKPKS